MQNFKWKVAKEYGILAWGFFILSIGFFPYVTPLFVSPAIYGDGFVGDYFLARGDWFFDRNGRYPLQKASLEIQRGQVDEWAVHVKQAAKKNNEVAGRFLWLAHEFDHE